MRINFDIIAAFAKKIESVADVAGNKYAKSLRHFRSGLSGQRMDSVLQRQQSVASGKWVVAGLEVVGRQENMILLKTDE